MFRWARRELSKRAQNRTTLYRVFTVESLI
jgi:hypothetical protein